MYAFLVVSLLCCSRQEACLQEGGIPRQDVERVPLLQCLCLRGLRVFFWLWCQERTAVDAREDPKLPKLFKKGVNELSGTVHFSPSFNALACVFPAAAAWVARCFRVPQVMDASSCFQCQLESRLTTGPGWQRYPLPDGVSSWLAVVSFQSCCTSFRSVLCLL